MRMVARSVLVGLSWFSLGCTLLGGGDSNLPKAVDYKLPVPENWTALSKGEADLAYRMASGNWVAINSSCVHSNANPQVLTRQLLLGFRQVRISRQEKIAVGMDEGLLSDIDAEQDGNRVHLLIAVVPKGDCVFDFTCLSKKEISLKDREEFQKFIRGLQYGSR